MISAWARRWATGILAPLAGFLHRLGISPNALSLLGMALALVAMALLALGEQGWGAIAVILAGGLDALDGALARQSGKSSAFGAFLDSTLDRAAEAAIYGGLLYYYVRGGSWLEPLMIYATITGSFLVSYARARAEGLGLECKVGLLTRLERLVILIVALLVGQITPALVLLAVLTNLTAIQRVLHVWRVTQESGGPTDGSSSGSGSSRERIDS